MHFINPHTYVRIHTSMHMHTCSHQHVRTHTCTLCTHARTHTHTYTHYNTHTHTHKGSDWFSSEHVRSRTVVTNLRRFDHEGLRQLQNILKVFVHEGLRQLQNSFVTDEDLRGWKVLHLSTIVLLHVCSRINCSPYVSAPYYEPPWHHTHMYTHTQWQAQQVFPNDLTVPGWQSKLHTIEQGYYVHLTDLLN